MNEELRAAAERVRNQNWDHFPTINQRSLQPGVDVALLADAYLAEHPADDAELVTEEWLRSVGFSKSDWILRGSKKIKVQKNPMSEDPRISWSFLVWDEDWHAQGFVTNRGLVRRLCKALGIELTEKPSMSNHITKPNRICEICSTPFHAYPNWIKRGDGRFCSRPCVYRWLESATVEERFKKKIGSTNERGCILWAGSVDKDGYGKLYPGKGLRGNLKAHRVAYKIAYGPFEESLHVLHHCDNPLCVNPTHLFLGTNDDNVADMVSKLRNRRGESVVGSILTELQVAEIVRLYATGDYFQYEIGQRFGISQSHVSQVVRGRVWKHVTKTAAKA